MTGGVWTPEHVRVLRFRDMALGFGKTPSRLYFITLVGRDARTLAGVAIGDHLDKVKRVYRDRDPSCGEEHGDNGPLWRSCFVRVGARFLYFGGDPISQISLQPPRGHSPPASPRDRASVPERPVVGRSG